MSTVRNGEVQVDAWILVEWMLNFSQFYNESLLKLSSNLKWPDDCFTDSKLMMKGWSYNQRMEVHAAEITKFWMI